MLVHHPKVELYSAQTEKCSKTGRLHIQWYVKFKKRERCLHLKNFLPPGAHAEVCRGTTLQNSAYTSKTSTKVPGGKQVSNIIDRTWKPCPFEDLYEWQKVCSRIATGSVHDRHIYWFHGSGDTGKTFMLRYLVQVHKARILAGGNRHVTAVVSKTAANCGLYVFHLPYAANSRVSYKGMETAKDCVGTAFFGTKYLDDFCFLPATVIVLSNFPPAVNQMSKDRFQLFDIDKPIIKDPEGDFVDMCVSNQLTPSAPQVGYPISAAAQPVNPKHRLRDAHRDRDRIPVPLLEPTDEEFMEMAGTAAFDEWMRK